MPWVAPGRREFRAACGFFHRHMELPPSAMPYNNQDTDMEEYVNAPGHYDKAADIAIEGTPYRILDKDGCRQLMIRGDDASVHSEMLLSAPDVLASAYARLMLNALPFAPRLDDVLLIGLGGGQQARFLYRRLPEARLVAVEADPDMVRIARTWFRLPPDDGRLSVVIGDGGSHVAAHPQCCDVLLCDGYDHTFNVPATLAGEDFYQACRRALRPGGVMAQHLDRRAGTWRASHLRMLQRIFVSHLELPVNESQSVLLLFQDACTRDYAALVQRARRLDALLDLELSAFIGSLALYR
jgi:spermidine synthase